MGLLLLVDSDAIRLQVSLRDGLASVLIGPSRGHNDEHSFTAGANQRPTCLGATTTSDEAYLLGGGLTVGQFSAADDFDGGAHTQSVSLSGVLHRGRDLELLLGGDFSGS